jgi:hypothetical protein
MSSYFGSWTKKEDVIDAFDVNYYEKKEIDNADIIVAVYSEGSYDGSAFILFRKDGHLFEVNDSHCSCNGLNNWQPEVTTKEALLLRSNDYGIWADYGDELKPIIEGLEV